MHLATIDLLLMGLYFLATISIGLFFAWQQSAGAFWVNDRNTPALLLGTTIVATQIGAGAVIGTVSATYDRGIGYAVAAAAAIIVGFSLLAKFGPLIRAVGERGHLVTVAGFFGHFFSKRVHIVVGLTIFVVYIFFCAAQVLAISEMLTVATGLATHSVVWITVMLMVGYTGFVGLRGDVYTGIMHTAVVIIAFIFVVPSVLAFSGTGTHVLSKVPGELLNPTYFGGYLFLLASVFFGGLFPLVSAEFWQLIYSSNKRVNFVSVFIGSAAVVVLVYISCATIGLYMRASGATGNADTILYTFIDENLQVGLRGILIAAILSAVTTAGNAMLLVLTSNLIRDLELFHDKASFRLIATVISALVAASITLLFPSIVQLALNAIFTICVLAIPFLGIVLGAKSERGAFYGVIAGVLSTLISIVVLPRQAFVPGVAICLIVYLGSYLLDRRHIKI